jgi:hypothetical protein
MSGFWPAREGASDGDLFHADSVGGLFNFCTGYKFQADVC